MRTVFVFLFALFSFLAQAQTYVWEGDGMVGGMPLLNINQGTVYPELSFMHTDAYLTATDEKIFKGRSTSVFDEVFWVQDDKLYTDQGHFSTDCVVSYIDGKIYRGDSRMFIDQLFTFKDGMLYEGNQTTRLDILYTFQGDVSIPELFAVLLVLELI